jgi:transposase
MATGMARKTVTIDRNQQFDLLRDTPAPDAEDRLCLGASGRKFNTPNREQIYLGMTCLDDYLKQAGLKAPLTIAPLLDAQNWREFEDRYAPTGRAPYAPQAMMGLILYGISQGTDSLRGLERFARQDLGCMWITGGICPDHACIGRFILLHEDSISNGFFESLTRAVLKVSGSDSRHLAGDGTVIEAACSYYNLLREEAITEQASAARKVLAAGPQTKEQQQKANLALQTEGTFNTRKQARMDNGAKTNSLSVSPLEPEAMVQTQKRHRGKAAAYQPSVLVNEQRVILAHDVDPSSETKVIAGLLAQSKRVTGEEVNELSLDAGYCCDTVIETAIERDISLLCPEKRPTRKVPKSVFPKTQFRYIAVEDAYKCPAGEWLRPGSQDNSMYRTTACKKCLIRGQCTKAKEGRRIRRLEGDEAREALREVMEQPQARNVFRQRQAMVEPVFGVLRSIHGLTRFRRRGLAGVKREFALHALAYNLSRAVAALFGANSRLYRHLQRIIGGYRHELVNHREFQLRSHWKLSAPNQY